MDSGDKRKRLWEAGSPNDSQFKRRTAVIDGDPPPHPSHAGHYPGGEDPLLGQRRLPPLYVPSCGTSAPPVTESSRLLSSPLFNQLGEVQPRSQSLFGNFQQPPQWHGTTSGRMTPRYIYSVLIHRAIFYLDKPADSSYPLKTHSNVVHKAKADYRTH
jgi:hypothetical protein